MLKRLLVALAFAGLLSPAYSAGTLPGFSVSQQMDKFGKPLAGCKLFIIQAGTTGTPQDAFFDSGLTSKTPNPLICDAAGRIGQFFLADGSIKVRLTDVNNVQILTADGLLVVGPSGGGGGGGGVDPTTILQTGWIQPIYGTGVVAGFVRLNGRTIGSATSGATERANADTLALFSFLYADPNLVVSGGRGVSAAADFAANKTIALPDARERSLAGLGDMGNADAARLTLANFGCSPVVLGCAGGLETRTLLATNVPPINSTGTITVTSTTNTVRTDGSNVLFGGGAISFVPQGATTNFITSTGANSMLSTGTNSTPFATTPPSILITIYIKL